MSEGLNCIDWGSIEALVSLAFVFFTLYKQKFCYLQQQSTNRRFPRALDTTLILQETPFLFENRHKKLKKKSVPAEGTTKAIRKIRIIYHDLDATDSSTDEERPDKSHKSKRIIHGINLQGDVRQSKAPELHTGVRQRKWGKWAAEIRDPFQRRRLWLGTYNTPEEASQAYNTKKLELEAKKNNNQSSPAAAYLPQNHLAASWGLENVSSRASPTSVLEMELVALASHINHECNDMVKDVGNKINVVEQQVRNLDPVDEQLNLSQIGEGLDFEMELKCLFTDDFPQLPDDLSNHDDLQTCRLKDGEPTDLPDFDFDLGDEECVWMDEPSNIAYP
ncbi:unnamed protein product [Camellia sinensis]